MTTRHLQIGTWAWLLLLAFASSSPAAAPGYFETETLDSAPLASSSRSATATRSSERYLRLMARLSVFAMYCDPERRLDFNSQVSRLRGRTQALDRRAQADLGGMVRSYNRLEEYRNEESLRMVRTGLLLNCQQSERRFLELVRSSARELEGALADPPVSRRR